MFAMLLSLLVNAVHLLLGIGTPQSFPPPLSAADEQAAFIAKLEGDESAREKLILHNLRLVSHIVRKYYSTAKNQEDLVSIGSIGLVKAIDSFDYTNGARFATYGAKCIQNAILSQMRLWFRINPPRAEKHQNGVFWHRFPRISTYFAPLRRAM